MLAPFLFSVRQMMRKQKIGFIQNKQTNTVKKLCFHRESCDYYEEALPMMLALVSMDAEAIFITFQLPHPYWSSSTSSCQIGGGHWSTASTFLLVSSRGHANPIVFSVLFFLVIQGRELVIRCFVYSVSISGGEKRLIGNGITTHTDCC